MLGVGVGLAPSGSVVLAFVPRLPSPGAANGLALSSGSPRITGGTRRRQRVFAVTQIAASFVLLAGAAALLKTLLALQAVQTGFDTRQVLTVNVPVMSEGRTPVHIVSQSVAQRMFPNQDAVNHHIMWTDPVMKFVGISPAPRRIVGIAKDVDDENIVPGPALTIYNSFDQGPVFGGRMFIHAHTDPYSLVTPITRIIRGMSAEQPVEKAATLEDVRAEVLTPDRLNTLVFGGFAAVALLLAVVGVAGVLAFSVSGRTREFGIRLAIGSEPRNLVVSGIREGAWMAVAGIAAGADCGFALALSASSYITGMRMPGSAP